MLALSDTAGVVLLILGGIFVVASGGVLFLRSRGRKEPVPDIPDGMKPGPSDAALEAPLLHKLQGWGLVLVTFFVVWIPVYWLAEPGLNLSQEEALKTEAIDRGERAVELFSEENQLGVGCVRCHGPELRGGVITNGANPDGSIRYAYPPNLTTICGGPYGNPPHNAIASIDDIYQVIEQGRVEAGMPSWSIRYQGALDDQQVNDLVNYLVAMSSENIPFEDNVCINPDASERATEELTAAGTVLERP
jgi:mono/diheme cytochrome c family protein